MRLYSVEDDGYVSYDDYAYGKDETQAIDALMEKETGPLIARIRRLLFGEPTPRKKQ